MTSHSKTKCCLICGQEYTPRQYATQLYCGSSCKEKSRFLRSLEEGKPKKGGYSRSTYIRVWMKARGEKEPYTAPCTYCGKQLSIDDKFNLDHTVPRGKLTYEQIKSEKFLTLACQDCNQAKGTLSVSEFTGGNK